MKRKSGHQYGDAPSTSELAALEVLVSLSQNYRPRHPRVTAPVPPPVSDDDGGDRFGASKRHRARSSSSDEDDNASSKMHPLKKVSACASLLRGGPSAIDAVRVPEFASKHGVSQNYAMKLLRRTLEEADHMALPDPIVLTGEGDAELRVFFDDDGRHLFPKTEVCAFLGIKGTTFTYWCRQSHVDGVRTRDRFRLMDACRRAYGGRSSFVLYDAASLIKVMDLRDNSRQQTSCARWSDLRRVVEDCLSNEGRRPFAD